MLRCQIVNWGREKRCTARLGGLSVRWSRAGFGASRAVAYLCVFNREATGRVASLPLTPGRGRWRQILRSQGAGPMCYATRRNWRSGNGDGAAISDLRRRPRKRRQKGGTRGPNRS